MNQRDHVQHRVNALNRLEKSNTVHLVIFLLVLNNLNLFLSFVREKRVPEECDELNQDNTQVQWHE